MVSVSHALSVDAHLAISLISNVQNVLVHMLLMLKVIVVFALQEQATLMGHV